MVHARVSDEYIHFILLYTTGTIFPVLSIKHLVNQDDEPTTPHKLATVTKPSVSKPCVLFFPRLLQRSTAHVDTKVLNIYHQSQKGFQAIFVGIPQHKNVTSSTYLVHGKWFLHMTLYLTKHFLGR